MAQTGYTPILIYSSSTASAAPAAGSLTNSTLGSELAINITDGKLFYKDNANAIQVIGWKTVPTTAGGTGLTSYTAGDLIYYASGTTFTKLGIGSAYQALQVNAGGTAPSWQPSASSVLTAQGDLLYASAANTLARLAKSTTATRYLANTGTTNNPQWDQVNLANGVTGTLPTGNGGTGLTSFTANGVVYASSASALTTGSALTFDGTNFATTGLASATKFVPTGGTAGGNGMYLPATDTLGWSTNGTRVMSLNASGDLLLKTTTSLYGVANRGTFEVNGTSTAIMALKINDAGGAYFYSDGTNLDVWNVLNGYLRFGTNNTERVRISNAGNVSVGTNTEAGRVYTLGDGTNTALRVAANTSTSTVYCSIMRHENTTAGAYIQFVTDGNVETGRIYDLAGTMQYASSSDARLKTNVQPMQNGLQSVLMLNPCTFDMRRGEDVFISSAGLIAQEVHEVYPYVVGVGGDDENTNPWSVDYGKLTPLLIAAIKEQQTMIDELKAKVAAVEAQ